MLLTLLFRLVAGHGQLVNPRPRNSIDWLAGVEDPDHHGCVNMTGDACLNGQSASRDLHSVAPLCKGGIACRCASMTCVLECHFIIQN